MANPEGDPHPVDAEEGQSLGQSLSRETGVTSQQVSAEPRGKALGKRTQRATLRHISEWSSSSTDAATRQSSLIVSLPFPRPYLSGLAFLAVLAQSLGPGAQWPSQQHPPPPQDGCPPHRSSHQGNRCRWPHSGRGWASTHPPGPRSSCPCSLPGSGSGGCCPHPRRAPRFGTGG